MYQALSTRRINESIQKCLLPTLILAKMMKHRSCVPCQLLFIKHIVCVLNGRSSLGLNVEMTFSAEAA